MQFLKRRILQNARRWKSSKTREVCTIHYVCLVKYRSCDANTGFVHRSTRQHPLSGEPAPDIPLGFSAENTSHEVSLAASLSPLRVTEEDDDGKNFCVGWVESCHIWEVRIFIKQICE